MVYKFFHKKTSGSSATTLANKSIIKSMLQNEQLAEKLHQPIFKNSKKKSVFSIRDNIWGAD